MVAVTRMTAVTPRGPRPPLRVRRSAQDAALDITTLIYLQKSAEHTEHFRE